MHCPINHRLNRAVTSLVLGLALSARLYAEAPSTDLWRSDHLHAWCVACFDAKQRGPEERAAMLQKLGFVGYVQDWRPELPHDFDQEIDQLQAHHVAIPAWWFPTSAADPDAKVCLEAFKRHHIQPQLWVMGGGTFPTNAEEQAARVAQEADRIMALVKLAKPYGCPVELYNHNGWFGHEDNQLALLAELSSRGITNVGMVYNFSHAVNKDHDDSTNFPDLWKRMQPHVVAVNLAGIATDGHSVYLSQGAHELDMMRVIQQSGWHGDVGLIAEGGGDAEVTLSNYLKGLAWCDAELKQAGSGGAKPSFAPSEGDHLNADANGAPVAPPPVPAVSPSAASASPAADASAPGHSKPAIDMSVNGLTFPNRDALRTFPITVEGWARFHGAASYNVFVVSDPKDSATNWSIFTMPDSGDFAVFLPVSGGGKLGGPVGDAYISFRLPL